MVLHGEGRWLARAGLRRRAKRFAMRARSEVRAGERCALLVRCAALRARVPLLFVAAGRRLAALLLLAAAVFLGISMCRIRLSKAL
jgi:hypothetical protein